MRMAVWIWLKMKAPPPKPPTTTPIAMPLLCGNQRMPIVIVGIRAMACNEDLDIIIQSRAWV